MVPRCARRSSPQRARPGGTVGVVWSDDGVNERNERAPAPDDVSALRAVAERVVTEAVEHLHGLPRPWEARTGPGSSMSGVSTKSSPTDVVTAADTAVEALVRRRLAELRPGEPVVGEERGGAAGARGVTWVVDPIDGTVNFLYGLPWYAVSLAATRDGATVAGAVAEPSTGRLWSAARGCGATCDGRELRVTEVTDLALMAALLPRVRDLRRAGSSALDVCAVAAGWMDAYVEHGTHWWDWAASSLIAEEAGAVVRTPGRPGEPAPDDGLGPDALLVAAPGVAAELTELLAELGAAQV
jgi:myo-inositol-1(or 4)-monophosphatase